jgi:hypothetical protein
MHAALVITTARSIAAIIHRKMSFERKFLSGSKIVSQNIAGPLVNEPEFEAKKFSQGKAEG